MATRKYELRARAEQQAETRQRIVAAVSALHREIGPARTTITAIAERAGVERLTVYRHFADEADLFAACSAHFREQARPPVPDDWMGIADPERRLRAALAAFYGYYRRGEDTIVNVARDAPRMPALAAVIAPWGRFVEWVRDDLVTAWRVRGRNRTRVTAAIGHALRFETWRSLARLEGLDDAEVVALMISLVRAVVGTHHKR